MTKTAAGLARLLVLPLLLAPVVGCSTLQGLADQGLSATGEPTTEEIVQGLQQALAKGSARAVQCLGQSGGYANDSALRIVFPEEAGFAASALEKIGLGGLVTKFEEQLNRGAEAGAKRALPIFETAIAEMTFADAKGVLFGGEHAATDYFHARTYASLVEAFAPELRGALGEYGAITAWTELTTQYNRIPFTSKKLDTDIVHYATERALDGLFAKLAAEEAQIRADPVARTTALLRRIFKYAERSQ